MIDLKIISKILFPDNGRFPKTYAARQEELSAEGLTMGTLIIGRPGTGKTTALAHHLVEGFKNHPHEPKFVLDWSGSLTDSILELILKERSEIRSRLLNRVVYDELGHPDWVIPMPEFSQEYGIYEEQVQRVGQNLVKLAPELVKDAPFLAGLGLRELAPQIFRLLTAVTNERAETWQITEAKRFIVDKGLAKLALNKFGSRVPGEARWFIEGIYHHLSDRERELRSYALLSLLGCIEPREIRARVGYPRPGWTPKEAIEKGQMILVNGARLINQKNAQHYLFTQVYSLIMSEINKRTPGNPHDAPVALVMDEVYSLLSIPGMAEEVAMLSPLYRSRKLQLYIVLQSLAQLAPNLREQVWSIGNLLCFAVSNFDEAYEIAQQLFPYEKEAVKLPAVRGKGQPIIETDRGQYLTLANKIQRMNHRECLIRRYSSERILEKYIVWVKQTKEWPSTPIENSVLGLKNILLKEKGIRVSYALDLINNRTLKRDTKPPSA